MPDRRYRRSHNRGGATLELASGQLQCKGDWTASCLSPVEGTLRKMRWPAGDLEVNMSGVSTLDMAGAWLVRRTVDRLRADGRQVTVTGTSDTARSLLDLVASGAVGPDIPRPDEAGLLEGLGRSTAEQALAYLRFLSFIGHITFLSLRILLTPATMYWKVVVQEIEEAGFDSLPIVGLLAMLIGVVIAYQGGVVLEQYGGAIFIADLVGLSVIRELAPLMTAIIIAGRTGSAYTAQIGTMQVTEEVDALRSMGITPIEFLVLPKLFALVVSLPLLTLFADVMGLLGGMLMANAMLDVSFITFLERLNQVIDLRHFLAGLGKAPVFAIIISAVGCYQGFMASGGPGSVGRRTTICVVQSIFLVIVVDALFSVVFSRLGI